jgi:hypothetical protein
MLKRKKRKKKELTLLPFEPTAIIFNVVDN